MTAQLKEFYHISANPVQPVETIEITPEIEAVQERLNRIFCGNYAIPEDRALSEDHNLPFAPFLLAHKERAGALSALCEKIMDETTGDVAEDLNLAVSTLESRIGCCPAGMVQHAAMSFLIHSKIAGKYLAIPSLHIRQPGATTSSLHASSP